jgi:hypothetical protein
MQPLRTLLSAPLVLTHFPGHALFLVRPQLLTRVFGPPSGEGPLPLFP